MSSHHVWAWCYFKHSQRIDFWRLLKSFVVEVSVHLHKGNHFVFLVVVGLMSQSEVRCRTCVDIGFIYEMVRAQKHPQSGIVENMFWLFNMQAFSPKIAQYKPRQNQRPNLHHYCWGVRVFQYQEMNLFKFNWVNAKHADQN